jgi:MFS family permease
LVGGALTSKFTWRSTFYFLLAYGIVCLAMMIWLPETFRKERSMAWRLAMERAQKHAKEDLFKARKDLPVESVERKQAKTAFAAPLPSQLERTVPAFPLMNRIVTGLSLRSGEDNVKIHFRDVNVSCADPL